jgi:hypothetical protein
LVQDAPKPPAGRQHGSYIQAACNCMAQWPPGVDAEFHAPPVPTQPYQAQAEHTQPLDPRHNQVC